MKKKLSSLLLVLSLLLPTTACCASTAAASGFVAYASTQSVEIDGQAVTFAMYALKDANGNPTNYVKLRDIAYALNGTPAQFNVGWNGSVNLEAQTPYQPNGSEMQTPFQGDHPYEPATAVTYVDGAATALEAIYLTDDDGGGYTYYKLRDLGRHLGFFVDWTPERGVFIETGAAGEDYDQSSFAQRWMNDPVLYTGYPVWEEDEPDDVHFPPYFHGQLSESDDDFVSYEPQLPEWMSKLTYSYLPAASYSAVQVEELYRHLLAVTDVTPDIGMDAAVADFMNTYQKAARSDVFLIEFTAERWADGTAALNVTFNGTRTDRSQMLGGRDTYDDDPGGSGFITQAEAYAAACRYWSYTPGDVDPETGYPLSVVPSVDEDIFTDLDGWSYYVYELRWLLPEPDSRSVLLDTVLVEAEAGYCTADFRW